MTDAPSSRQQQDLPLPSFLRDQPALTHSDDLLQQLPVAHVIHRAIQSTPQEWTNRIGLYGPWGSGKTTVLNFLKELEVAHRSLVVSIPAWGASRGDHLIEKVFDELDKAAGGNPIKAFARNNAIGSVDQVASEISSTVGEKLVKAVASAGFDFAGLGIGKLVTSGAIAGLKAWAKIDEAKLRSLLEKLTAEKFTRVVVFIDDLDRADPRLVPQTLLAVRDLLDIPGFTFVLAFDQEVIAKALGEYSKAFGVNSQQFLEKIVDHPVSIPPLKPSAVANMAKALMEKTCGGFIPGADLAGAADFFPPNPRTMKLVVRKLLLLRDVAKRHDPNELNWYGLILQIIFQVAAPADLVKALEPELGFRVFQPTPLERVFSRRTEREFEAELEGSSLIDQVLDSYVDEESGFHHQRQWLRTLIAELISVRERDDPSKIAYEMGMMLTPPPFTKRELSELWVQTVQPDHDWAGWLAKALDGGGLRSNQSALDVATAFMDNITDGYLDALKTLASADTALSHSALSMETERWISCLHHLWKTTDNPEIGQVRSDSLVSGRLLRVLEQHWAEQPVVDANGMELAKACVQASTNPLALLCKVNPAYPRPESMTEATALLNDAVAKQMLRALGDAGSQFDSILAAADETQRSRALWFLINADSPLYNQPNLEQLIAIFNRAMGETSPSGIEHVARRAGKFLGSLEPSNIPPELRPAFVSKLHELIAIAWKVYTRVRFIGRAEIGVERRWNELVRAGVDESLIPKPEWLPPTACGNDQAPGQD